MGTRSGDLDPGIIFYLQRKGYDTETLDALLNKKSGLLGVSGSSNDVRDLELKADLGDAKAQLALDVFAYRIKKYIGAYMAVLNRVDAIIFTGGIGENGVAMRARILREMDQLGIQIDEYRNEIHAGVEGEDADRRGVEGRVGERVDLALRDDVAVRVEVVAPPAVVPLVDSGRRPDGLRGVDGERRLVVRPEAERQS